MFGKRPLSQSLHYIQNTELQAHTCKGLPSSISIPPASKAGLTDVKLMTTCECAHPGLLTLFLSFIIHPVPSLTFVATPTATFSPNTFSMWLANRFCPSLVLFCPWTTALPFSCCIFLLGLRKHTRVLVCVETSLKKVSYSQNDLVYFKRYLSDSSNFPDSLLQLTHYKPPASQIPGNWSWLPVVTKPYVPFGELLLNH